MTSLIIAGSFFITAGVLAPFYREFEFGPTNVRFAGREAEAPAPWMVAEAENLANVARLVLGDPELARDAVEDTLSMVRRVGRRIPRDEREMIKLKTLVATLDRADRKRALRVGRHERHVPPMALLDVLQQVDFRDRIAFALRAEYPIKEVAEILDGSEEGVATSIERAQKALDTYEGPTGGIDGR